MVGGPGFTEWRNVVKGRPRFSGHYQPHLPLDLGFYDMRLPDTRMDQANLAGQYGIYGFCYYHYWFNGKKILQKPLEAILKSGEPHFPFMLAWANENWTRVWDGGERSVLMHQYYSEEDDRQHVRYLIPFFKDTRYIRIDGRPVFAIYKDKEIPVAEETVRVIRHEAKKHGIELYLCRFDIRDQRPEPPGKIGFDAAIEFPPFDRSTAYFLKEEKQKQAKKRWHQRLGRIVEPIWSIIPFLRRKQIDNSHTSYSYKRLVEIDLRRKPSDYLAFPAVCPSWDNTARRQKGGGSIFVGSSPEEFGKWVYGKVNSFTPPSPEENLFFINAWNEWAEGNHLEPCEKYGHQYLEALRDNLPG